MKKQFLGCNTCQLWSERSDRELKHYKNTLSTKGPGFMGDFHSWKPVSELGFVTWCCFEGAGGFHSSSNLPPGAGGAQSPPISFPHHRTLASAFVPAVAPWAFNLLPAWQKLSSLPHFRLISSPWMLQPTSFLNPITCNWIYGEQWDTEDNSALVSIAWSE